MTPTELIRAYRQEATSELSTSLLIPISFQPGPVENGYPTDVHLEFRAEVVEALLADFSLGDIGLIRALFHEEMRCEAAIWRHDSLYQVCFYLYELGQLEDCFRLYEAKFLAQHLDMGTLLDRELMTVRHDLPEVIRYVEDAFRRHPPLQKQYPTIRQELAELQSNPTYESLEAYRSYLRGYFYGPPQESLDEVSREEVEATPEASGYVARPKPWWKFW